MIYVSCDMNCNNFGNYFRIIAHERGLQEDETSYIVDGSHYPKAHCYRGKPAHPIKESFRYSEAIDVLHPDDYLRWKMTRFGKDLRRCLEEIKSRAGSRNDYLSRMDVAALLEIVVEQ